ncbi:MAG TPA: SDR family oxidoreductase [Candidatus Angelobacter sp.]
MVIPAFAGALSPKNQRETALITGASSGIGLELARLMAPDFDLILTARNQAILEQRGQELEEHGNRVHVVPADLAQQDSPEQIFAEIRRRGLQVDVLINNAGFGGYGPFAETDLRNELEMIRVNISALTHLTKLALPGMLERKHGRIMNVASTAGFQPGPLMAVYYATKAYVISFSEAIANELKGSGITVTCLCPGATATEFAKRADMEKSRLFKMGKMQSADVARAGYSAMMRGKTLLIPGARNWMMAESVRFSPRKLVTAIARSVQEREE